MKIFVFWWMCLGASFASEFTMDENRAQVEGLEKWGKIAELAANMPKQEAISTLSEGILKTSRPSMYSIDGTEVITQKLRNALLSIPGHAEYFESQVKDLQTKFESASKDDKWNYRKDYGDIQQAAFQTLSHLPSPETVKVLGDFLSDVKGGIDFTETGPNPTEGQIMSQQKKNCDLAALTLFKLIANPPMEDVGWLKPDAVEAWLEWYEQVKAGGRTFRFKGDPIEYDLAGPAPKAKLQRVERDRKRDEERDAGHRKSSTALGKGSAVSTVTKPLSIAGILATCALCAGAVWYYVRGRKAA